MEEEDPSLHLCVLKSRVGKGMSDLADCRKKNPRKHPEKRQDAIFNGGEKMSRQ